MKVERSIALGGLKIGIRGLKMGVSKNYTGFLDFLIIFRNMGPKSIFGANLAKIGLF